MDVFDPNILQRVFLEAILQVGIKKSIGDLGPECPFNETVRKCNHVVLIYAVWFSLYELYWLLIPPCYGPRSTSKYSAMTLLYTQNTTVSTVECSQNARLLVRAKIPV